MLRSFRQRDLTLLFLAIVFTFASFSALTPTLPLYLQAHGASHFQVGVILGCFPVGVLLARAMAGHLIRRWGRRRALTWSSLGAAVVPLLYLISGSSFEGLVGSRVIHGATLSVFSTAATVMIVDLAQPETRARVLAEVGLANYVGLALGPYLGELVYTGRDLTPVFALMSVTALASAVLGQRIAESDPHCDVEIATRSARGRALGRPVLIVTLVFLFAAIAHGAAFTFVPLLNREHGLGPASLFYVAFAISTAVTRILGGGLPDRFGRLPMSLGALWLSSTSILGLSIAPGQMAVLMAGLGYGIAFGFLQPALLAQVADYSDFHNRGFVIGLFYSALDLGFITAGFALGAIADLIGVRSMFTLAAFLPLISSGIVLFSRGKLEVRKVPSRRTEPEATTVLIAAAVR